MDKSCIHPSDSKVFFFGMWLCPFCMRLNGSNPTKRKREVQA